MKYATPAPTVLETETPVLDNIVEESAFPILDKILARKTRTVHLCVWGGECFRGADGSKCSSYSTQEVEE